MRKSMFVMMLAALILLTGCAAENYEYHEDAAHPELIELAEPIEQTGQTDGFEIVAVDYLHINALGFSPRQIFIREGDSIRHDDSHSPFNRPMILERIEYAYAIYIDGEFAGHYAVDARFSERIVYAVGRLTFDADGNGHFTHTGFPAFPQLSHQHGYVEFHVTNPDEAIQMAKNSIHEGRMRVLNDTLVFDDIPVIIDNFRLNTTHGNTAEITGVIDRYHTYYADYIFVCSADYRRGIHQLRRGDSFLGLTLEDLPGQGKISRTPDNSFFIQGDGQGRFSGEIVLTGDLWIGEMTQPNFMRLGITALFTVRDEEYLQRLPTLASSDWQDRWRDYWYANYGQGVWFSNIYIVNKADLFEMLGIGDYYELNAAMREFYIGGDWDWGGLDEFSESNTWEFENITIRVKDFGLNTRYTIFDDATIVEIIRPEENVVEFSVVDYVYVTAASDPRGAQRLGAGDTFLGLTLIENDYDTRIAYIKTINGEFASHIDAHARFEGEITVTGDLSMTLYETQFGWFMAYFSVHEQYLELLPMLAHQYAYESMNLRFTLWGHHFGFHIENLEDLLEMLGLDKDEAWGTRPEFENLTITINNFTLREGYRAFDSATIIEIVQ